jgi:hypothetical protein
MGNSFQVWDRKKHRMVGQQWVLHDPEDRYEVLIYCGAKDRNKMDISDNDIIEFNGSQYRVVYDASKLKWVLIPHKDRESTLYQIPFNQEMASKSEVIGNVLQQTSQE